MTLVKQCSLQAFVLLFVLHSAAHAASTSVVPCMINKLNHSLGSNHGMTWDMRYPGNRIAQALDRILTGKIPGETGRKEVLNEVAASFQSRGIKFKRVMGSNGHESLIILPIDRATNPNSNSLNRLAAGILKYDSRFELRYTPEKISDSYVEGTLALQGIEDGTGHRWIEIGHAAAIEGSANDQALVHEIIHAKHLGDESRGKIHPYSIQARALEPTSILKKRTGLLPASRAKAYSSFLKFDELVTFRHNLWRSARNYVEAVKKGQDLSLSQKQMEIAINGSMNVSNQAWVAADLGDAALRVLKKIKNFDRGTAAKFEHEGFKYRSSIEIMNGKDGKPYAALFVEELPGFFSQKRAVTSFALKIPLKATHTRESGVPTELIHQYMDDIRGASKKTFEAADMANQILEKLENANSLADSEKANLLQMLENFTRREVPPGYSKR